MKGFLLKENVQHFQVSTQNMNHVSARLPSHLTVHVNAA